MMSLNKTFSVAENNFLKAFLTNNISSGEGRAVLLSLAGAAEAVAVVAVVAV